MAPRYGRGLMSKRPAPRARASVLAACALSGTLGFHQAEGAGRKAAVSTPVKGDSSR